MGLISLLTENKWTKKASASFWEHLDELRSVLFKTALITIIAATAVFCFKDTLFEVVLAPIRSNFFLYRWFGFEPFSVPLVSIDITEQLMMHIKVSIYVGLLIASPYILYALFGFISPALYEKERRNSAKVLTGAYLMFVLGTALNYCLVFPLMVRFMATYNVSPDVESSIRLSSYVNTLLKMNLMMGLMFELPVVCWIMGRLGIISAKFMSKYRRHAIVLIFAAAMIITPTTDVVSLLIVSVPIWMLYELSIMLVRATAKKPDKPESPDTPDEPETPEGPQTPDEPQEPQTPDTQPDAEADDAGTEADDADAEVNDTESDEAGAEDNEPKTEAPTATHIENPDFLWEEERLREWGYEK